MSRTFIALRRWAVRMFFRHRAVRELIVVLRWPRLRRKAPDLAHIPLLAEVVFGPVQGDEALLLFGLIRVLRPAVLLEIGFYGGVSALNFLRAMDPDARLYSVDIDPDSAERARDRLGNDPRLSFRLRSQDAIERADLDGERADFVFLDASHDLELNKVTFERLRGMMAERALLVVHDTGTLPRDLVPPSHQDLARAMRHRWTEDAEYEHVPAERAFVNWILDTSPEFAQIHLHSSRTPRWGMTVLQRSSPLARPPAPTGSAELSYRIERAAAYPPLSEMGERQGRELLEALLDADSYEDLPAEWQAAISKAEENLPELRRVVAYR